VTRHTSIRYSSSCHTRVIMGVSMFFTVAVIRVPCHPWCTHRNYLVVKKLVQFSCGCEQFD
jgi:hypothetical protein